MWLLKRAPHLTPDEFRDWWLTRHAPDIAADQSPYLKRHVVDVRVADVDGLAGRPDQEPEWDGIAEQWFETEADYNAVYGRAVRPTRADTLVIHPLSSVWWCGNTNSGCRRTGQRGISDAL